MSKKILDVCCGGRMMYWSKNDIDTIYADIRNENYILDGRKVNINPDIIMDFRKLEFADNSFKLVVFDPPHLTQLGANSHMALKYGKLLPTWETDLKAGFDECIRVLEPFGILIFKWNENQIPVKKIIEIFNYPPLLGQRNGKKKFTHWIIYMKRNY